jgi:ABC-type polysaccharide/polyol phosphate transport system, ATPase component
MININNVSMKFDLGIEKNFSFKLMFVSLFDTKKEKKKKEYFWALNDVSFHVDKGEVVGLIGSNGAGKSTLLKVVSGVMKPTSGGVTVNGSIAPMIELGAGFDPELTARENIYLNGAVLGHSKIFLESKFQEIVDFSELHDFLDAPVKNFSSGMVAKLAFSISTIVDPEILIVDEILSVGDIKFQEKSRNKMMEMIKGGTTVLYVSHSMASIEELCDKVIWLEHGKVIMAGDTKEVCKAYYLDQMGETAEESAIRKAAEAKEKEKNKKKKSKK